MKTTIIIIAGIAFLACAYYYHKRKQEGQITPELEIDYESLFDQLVPEDIEQLSKADVIAYFKGLNLKKGIHIPFVAQTLGDSRKIYLLALYNENTQEIENYKAIAPSSVDQDLLDLIGQERMIVLN